MLISLAVVVLEEEIPVLGELLVGGFVGYAVNGFMLGKAVGAGVGIAVGGVILIQFDKQ